MKDHLLDTASKAVQNKSAMNSESQETAMDSQRIEVDKTDIDSCQGEQLYHFILENLPDNVFASDEQGHLVYVNKAAEAYGYPRPDLLGHKMLDMIHPLDRERISDAFTQIRETKKDGILSLQFRIQTKDGTVRWVESRCAVAFSPDGHFLLQQGISRDITARIEAQQALLKTQDELEELVQIRTLELTRANRDLKKEIEERRDTEMALREREKELEMEKMNLEETNTALKVLLKRRELDKRALEEQVMYNVKKLIQPYLEKLQQKTSHQRRQAYLSIIETNLSDITNPFTRRLSIEFFGLTNAELKVANFIRQGKKTKEIADLLSITVRTVEAYRLSIRRKLRIQNQKVNLRTFLMSLT